MKRIQGLYGITDPQLIADQNLYDTVSQAIDGGLAILQYRNKVASQPIMYQQAEVLKKLCEANQVLFFVNDSLELAKSIDADGVHIGKHDGAIAAARKALGENAIIGVSCYNQLENALAAEQAGADYIAFGRFFGSQTKPEAIQAYPELIVAAKDKISLPIVAIGGISIDNADILLQAGADSLAVIHGIFGQVDVYAACQALNKQFLPYQ